MPSPDQNLREVEDELRDKQEQLRELAEREQHYRDLLLEAGDEIRRLRDELSQQKRTTGATIAGDSDSAELGELRQTVELQRKAMVDMREQLHSHIESASRHEAKQRELDDLRRQLEESEQIRVRQKKALSVVGEVNSAREEEIERMRREASSSTEEVDRLRSELVETAGRVSSLEAELEELPKLREESQGLAEQHRQALASVERLETRIAALVPLESQSEELAKRVATLAGERDQARAESAELRSKSGGLEQRVREAEALELELEGARQELESSGVALEAARKDLESARKDADTVHEDLERVRSELQSARERGEQLDARGRELELEAEALRQERGNLQEQLAARQREKEAIAEELRGVTAERERIRTESLDRTADAERLAHDLEKANAATARVEESVAELSTELDRVQAARERDTEVRDQLISEIAELREVEKKYQKLAPAREALQRRVDELERAQETGRGSDPELGVLTLTEADVRLEHQLAAQAEELALQVSSLQEARAEIDELRGRLANAELQAREADDRASEQVHAVASSEALHRLEAELAAAVREKSRLAEEIEQAGALVSSEEGQLEALQAEIEDRGAQLATSRGEAEEAQRRGSELERELESLRAELTVARLEQERTRMLLDRAEARAEAQQVARSGAPPAADGDDLQPGDRFVRELRADLGEEES
ncbi:MAG TPA: hypothetical protein VNB06_07030 [Thermoanaerobaculia bacterium]|nr:hypothetical protein [Thermoanaerobaculia bacterium]